MLKVLVNYKILQLTQSKERWYSLVWLTVSMDISLLYLMIIFLNLFHFRNNLKTM
jgi:hypothetical protein